MVTEMNGSGLFTTMKKNGNLHIGVHGEFTSKTAFNLAGLMSRSHCGEGNIIINTTMVTKVTSESTQVFNDTIGGAGLQRQKIYLVGAKGLEICQMMHQQYEREKRRKIIS